MKKLMAVLLAAAMLLCLLAGCGSTETEVSEAPEASEEAAVSEAPAVEEAPPEEMPAEEEVPVEPEEPEIVIAYPLGNGTAEVTYWTDFDGNAFGNYGLTTYNDLQSVPVIQEKTGVLLKYQEVSFFTAPEQFNLMIASGDWADVFNAARYYTGGLSQAYADEVILDLSEYIPQYMPDYYKHYQTRDAATLQAMRTDGLDLQLCSMYDLYVNDGGTYCRGDWMAELGYESFPTDFDEFIDLLYQVVDTYGCQWAITGSIPGAQSKFNSAIFNMDNSLIDLAMYLDDEGSVKSGMISTGFREYLELAIQLYKDGILNEEFYTTEFGRSESMANIGNGNIFIWSGRADTINDPLNYTDDPDFEVMPITTYFVDDTGMYRWGEEVVYANSSGLSIAADVEDLELIMNFYNYFFTEEGSVLANYGIEGVSYEMVDGTPQFTDMVLNNPDGMNFNLALVYYGCNGVVSMSDNTVRFAAYSDQVVEAIELFSDTSYITTEHTIPNGAALDAEEAASVATIQTDVVSYACEQCLKWATGAEELTDQSWSSYVETCLNMNLDTVIATYQKAYDDYIAEYGA